MNKLQGWLAGAGCALALFVTGCASDGSQRSTGQVIDDAAILTKAKAALVNDPVVSGMAINVDVHRGIVTLDGAVNGAVEKQKAEDIARGVDGVRAVENNLVVREVVQTTTSTNTNTRVTRDRVDVDADAKTDVDLDDAKVDVEADVDVDR
jgi:osmotically-inducible protein OsmY